MTLVSIEGQSSNIEGYGGTELKYRVTFEGQSSLIEGRSSFLGLVFTQICGKIHFMISDYEILGIEATANQATVKQAFRKKMKELHPDMSGGTDSFNRHSLFVEVCQAYQRLIDPRTAEPVRAASKERADLSGTGIRAHADSAYVFYKTGMRFFMKIHPSQWKIDTSEDPEKVKMKVLELVRLFPKAYYYFRIVAHEYDQSVWAHDAKVKIDMIEDMTKRYARIVQSFSTWDIDQKEVIRDYYEKITQHRNNREKMGDIDVKVWNR